MHIHHWIHDQKATSPSSLMPPPPPSPRDSPRVEFAPSDNVITYGSGDEETIAHVDVNFLVRRSVFVKSAHSLLLSAYEDGDKGIGAVCNQSELRSKYWNPVPLNVILKEKGMITSQL